MDSFSVKTNVFEGPLQMLLSLVEKRKLFINDISLSQVADDFIDYVKKIQEEETYNKKIVSDLAEFILIASTLVLIKSKSLLPELELTEEEHENVLDLEKRLREYQKYKNLALVLKDRFGVSTEYLREPQKEEIIIFAPDSNTTPSRFYDIIKMVISEIPKNEIVPKALVQKVISLEEMIQNLSERITRAVKMSFKQFADRGSKDHKEKRVNIIVSFLAMLELVKQGAIRVRQESDFEDIEMETEMLGVPEYN